MPVLITGGLLHVTGLKNSREKTIFAGQLNQGLDMIGSHVTATDIRTE
jgi:hypothetical protein